MKVGKNLFWIAMGILFLLAGFLVSYVLGLVISKIVVLISSIIKVIPGSNEIAEIVSKSGVILHIITILIMVIYFWSKYEDKTVIKNFKAAVSDLFQTLKNKDFKKEKAIIGEYSKKIKGTAIEAGDKIKNKIDDKKAQRENIDENQNSDRDIATDILSE